jgi:hypothetical protein
MLWNDRVDHSARLINADWRSFSTHYPAPKVRFLAFEAIHFIVEKLRHLADFAAALVVGAPGLEPGTR